MSRSLSAVTEALVTCILQVTKKRSILTFIMQVTRRVKAKTKKAEPETEARRFLRSPCAVACSLDLVGDKWTLLVVRDLLRGNVTYKELQNSPERIPTNILADRLKKLEDASLVAKSAYQEHPVRYAYRLTEKGEELGDVLMAFVRWGKKHIPGTRTMGETRKIS
jgi:DNA-binding HxlR family transcriptional regulator